MIKPMQTIKLLETRLAAPGQHLLTFTRPDGWTFRAGQFARLGLPVPGSEPLFRAYSIAGAPDEPVLRFLIKHVEGGALSPRLTLLPTDAEVLLDGEAQGNLLPERIPGGSDLWLFATGSGLAPFLSLLSDRSARAAWSRTVLVIGARTLAETEGLKALALERAAEGDLILTAASREEGPLTGRLPALLESGEIEAAAGLTLSAEASRVLLCGNPDFIKAMRALFKARGMVSPRFGKPGQLLVESLW